MAPGGTGDELGPPNSARRAHAPSSLRPEQQRETGNHDGAPPSHPQRQGDLLHPKAAFVKKTRRHKRTPVADVSIVTHAPPTSAGAQATRRSQNISATRRTAHEYLAREYHNVACRLPRWQRLAEDACMSRRPFRYKTCCVIAVSGINNIQIIILILAERMMQ